MLQTIEVNIDAKGHIHPLEALPLPYSRRALLTILPTTIYPNSSMLDEIVIKRTFGVLVATKTVSLDEMKSAVRKRGSKL